MKMKLYFIASLWLFSCALNAQTTSHNNTWYFGSGHTLQFTPSGPVAGIGIPTPPPQNLYSLHSGEPKSSIAVNNAQGNLAFFMQVIFTTSGSNNFAYLPKVFDRNGAPMPNGNIPFTNNDHGSGNPIVVPHPANNQQYYLFYVKGNALFYSLIDMALNNNLGDVVSAEKDIQLTGYGTITGRKITTVQGCNRKVWLLAANRTANQYFSFAITAQGLQTTPVISHCGNMPITALLAVDGYHGGVLKASNNSKHVVMGTQQGIELYDFEPCSGKLKNARKLDTVGALGLCFSPDDTKLYSTQLEKEWGIVNRGKVYQYAFDAANINATQASKTLVLENPIVYYPAWPTYTSGYLGDIKQGPDQKLYIANNAAFMSGDAQAAPLPPATSVFLHQGMHIIHQPNALAMACTPELNAITLLGHRDTRTGLMLPQDIVMANTTTPDTTAGSTRLDTICFAQNTILSANPLGACYLWDDGTTDSVRSVSTNGTYWVGYFKDCSYQTDTFHITFIRLPVVPQLNYGCPQEGIITIPAADSTTHINYTLYNSNGIIAASAGGIGAIQFTHLQAGDYTLYIAAGNCDTTLALAIDEFPKPTLSLSPTDTTIFYGDTIQLQVSGAYIYTWSPTAQLDTATKANPMAWPRKPTRYTVVGINQYGCRDEDYINVDINYSMPEFVPNAFSPNGDGNNDVFRLSGITHHKLSVFKIFNRYGQEIYNGTDPQQGWDGTHNGKPCDIGTYHYLIGITYPDGKTKTLKGDLTLIR